MWGFPQMESLPWLYAGDLNNGGRGDNMNALQFVSTPVQNFRLTRRQPRAKKDEESTSLFSTYSSTKTRKWVSPQHADISDCSQKLKPASRARKGQRVSAVRRKGKRSTAKGGVSCGRATVCSQQQHHRTIGTSILHYGMRRRNVRPIAMVGMDKKQNDAHNSDENCKQRQSLPSLTKNDDLCEVVPSRLPLCPLRDVVNTVPTPDSAQGRMTECRTVSLDGSQDMTAPPEPLHSGTLVSHCKDSTTSSEQLFSLTEVTLLQLSQLSTQLPRPEAGLVPPLLSSSPLPQATSEHPTTHRLLHVKQAKGCHGSNHPIKEISEELQKEYTSECLLMPFPNLTTAVNLHSMKTSNAQQPKHAKVEGDFVCAKDWRESPVTVELPVLSGETAAKGTSNGCGEPSMTDSLADIMQCLDFDLSLSFQAMQISKDSPGKILAPETPLLDGEYISTRRRGYAPVVQNC